MVKRRSTRPRRRYGKYARMGYRKVGRTLGSVHRFKETVQIGSLTAPPSSSGSGRISFQISDLTSWAQYKELFDLYKITGVKIKLVPKWNTSSPDELSATLTGGMLPTFYAAVNRSPYVPPPGSIGDILNDDGVKIIRVTRPMNFYIPCPKPDITNEGGNIPFQFGVSKKFQPWLTTGGNSQTVNQENVTHYGLRWYMENGSGNHEVVVDCYLTYYFTMKEQN